MNLGTNNFAALRLTLAASVIVFHTAFLSRAPAMAWFAGEKWSTFGIHGFFFISGFLVVMSFERSPTLRDFFEKRARRILPAYVAVVVAVAALLVFVSRMPAGEYFTDPSFYRYLVWNLAFSNFAAPTLPGVFEHNTKHAVNGSLWTIKIEVLFYLVVPLICLAIRRWGARRVLPALGIGSVVWGVGLQSLADTLHRPLLEQLAVQLPGQLCYFVAGIVVFYRSRAGLQPPGGWLALLGLCLYLLTSGPLWQVISPAAVYFTMAWATQRMPHVSSPNRGGDISYGIFLIHWPIVQVAVELGAFQHNAWLGAVGCWAIVAGLGYLSWFGVERPFLFRKHGSAFRVAPAAAG